MILANETRKLGLCSLKSLCSKDYYSKIANSRQIRTFLSGSKHNLTFRVRIINKNKMKLETLCS